MKPADLVQDSTQRSQPPTRYRVAVEFSIEGDLRFLSHHNTMKMLERCMVRAKLPIRYSQGFNPQPRFSLPLPRPVGVASDAELAWLELREPLTAADTKARLSDTLPAGCRIHRVTTHENARTPLPKSASYETSLSDDVAAGTLVRVRRLMSAESLLIRRDSGPGKPLRDVDIRPFVAELAIDGRLLRMRLRITEKGSAKPVEVFSELGLAAEEYVSRTRRTRVEWNVDLSGDD